MPHRAFIGIGTNLGDRLRNYRNALEHIGKLPNTRIVRQSSIYETEPVGELEGLFLNGAIEIETGFDARALLRRLLGIERTMGRERSRGQSRVGRKKQPKSRIIDLDLLLFDNEVIESPSLTVPHPKLHERRFVLVPLSELAPALVHPKLNQTVSEMLAGLKTSQRVTLMKPVPSRQRGAREVVLR